MARDQWTVEVVRSRNRRKTVQAAQEGNVVRVYMPATMTRADEEKWVDEMLSRMERRERRERAEAAVDLDERAALLSARHLDGYARPSSVRWVTNMRDRYGSCTPDDGTIRISDGLSGMPGWVLDYVIVHELVHLIEPSHNSRFWALVARYPRTERARGFLLAKGMDEDDA
jgi:predicted metal-dependent hydrolase